MNESASTLYGKFGGHDKVQLIVANMYERILADPELAPFFEKVSMDHLLRMQTEFIGSALDGAVKYTGAELTAVHRGRGISGKHFAKFCNHFADAAESLGVEKSVVDAALGRLAMYKDKVTGDTNVDG